MGISHRSNTYKDYIKSERWAERKRRHFASAAWKARCFVCDSPVALDVHHRTYERFENEADNDLVTLCRDCHTAVHADAKAQGVRFTNMHRERRREIARASGLTPPAKVVELGQGVIDTLLDARDRLRCTGYAGLAAKVEDAIEAFFGRPVPMDIETDKTLAK